MSKTHMERSIDLAGKVVSMADGALSGIDSVIRDWPGEFRAIVWDAVADIATRRAKTARKDATS